MSAAWGVNVRTGATFVEIRRVETGHGRRRRPGIAANETIAGPGRIRDNRAYALGHDEPTAIPHGARSPPPHQLADEHRAEAERGARGPARPGARARSSTWCCTRRDDALRGARPTTARVTFRAHRRRRRSSEVAATGPQPARRPVDRQVRAARRRARQPATRTATDNAYPLRLRRRSPSSSTHPAAPDLCVIHSAAHNWEDQGGHLGEHGSLGIVQARAPIVIGGKGVRSSALVPRAARLVDVAPTIAALLGCAPATTTARYLAVQDGDALTDVLDPAERPQHVVGFLFDGTNSNVLYDMARAARRRTSRASSRWASRSVTARWRRCRRSRSRTTRRSSPARTPATTASSTTRGSTAPTGEQVITNSQATWPWSMQHLTPGIESIHDAVHRTWPDAFTASVNEPCDTGADYSTFDFFRRGEVPPIPKDPFGLPAHDRALRAPVEGLLVVVGRRPHGHRPGARHHRRPATATSATRCRASCGATSRSPTRPCTKAARTRRWRPRRCATATAALGAILDALEQRGRVRRLRVRARRRPRHGGERPGVPRRLGRRAARPPGSSARDEGVPASPAVTSDEPRLRRERAQ